MMLEASLAALVCLFAAAPAGLSLRGTVLDAAGTPVAGARVDIATAAPRVGPALFCPSCYPDCRKWTRSDDRGRFEIRSLDPALQFRVLVSSPQKKARLTELVDPLHSELKVILEEPPVNFPRERTVLAQLVDERGRAVVGALLDPAGARTAELRWGGTVKDVDPTVSDAEGNFLLRLPKGYQAVDVQITAQGYTGALYRDLKPGLQRQRLTVSEGTHLTGRHVRAGQPVSGSRVAVVQTEQRASPYFIKAVGAVTDQDGKFTFDHLPAGEQYVVLTPVGEGPQKLVLTTKRFKTYGDRKERDLGDLEVVPARRLAGVLEVAAGQALPPEVRITLGRDPDWDLIAVPVGKDGRFAIDGLPPETYAVRVVAKGFAIDGTRLPYQMLREQAFGLRLRESVEDLRIPLTRGEPANSQP
jgi:hypothetical protein